MVSNYSTYIQYSFFLLKENQSSLQAKNVTRPNVLHFSMLFDEAYAIFLTPEL